jgi:ankyrin repeat protein
MSRAIITAVLSLPVLLSAGAARAADTVPKDTRLVEAAKAGNSDAAVTLLQKKVDVNVPEADGTTALHWAVRNNDLTLVDRLLRAGAKPAVANRFGVTPIYLACENASAEAVARLLKAGVNANTTGEFGETALMTCARTGNALAAKALIEAGASIDAVESWRGQTALMWAAAEGHADMVRALVAAGADVNARSTIVSWERQRTREPRDKWLPPGGLSPLLLAARQGKVDAVKALLDSHADINMVDPDRESALVLALINGHVDVATALIASGIDVNIADQAGRTALWAAVDLHTVPSSNRPPPRETDDTLTSLDVIKMLLDRGAQVDAAISKQIPYRTKLDRGGDSVLGAGTTPLLRAAKAADTPVIKLLLEHGANAKATTRNGVNGLLMAANVGTKEEDMTGRNKTQKDIIETVTVLMAAGLDINGADTNGRTAAHGAAIWGLTDVVKFLDSKGAKLDQKDKRGLTSLDAALGQAGGFGFDGRSGVVREETAKVIRELLGPERAAAAVSAAPAAPPPGRTQDDDLDK